MRLQTVFKVVLYVILRYYRLIILGEIEKANRSWTSFFISFFQKMQINFFH